MDIFFQDPSEIPLPPEEVRVRALRAEPWPSRDKVRAYLEVDPFQKRPSAEIWILNPDRVRVAEAIIIESMVRKIEITLHLRGARPPGEYTLAAVLFYSPPLPEPPAEEPGQGSEQGPVQELPEREIVDQKEVTFTI